MVRSAASGTSAAGSGSGHISIEGESLAVERRDLPIEKIVLDPRIPRFHAPFIHDTGLRQLACGRARGKRTGVKKHGRRLGR